MTRPATIVAALVLVLAARAALALPPPARLEIDAAASRVEFRLSGTLHETHGTFRVSRGAIAIHGDGRSASGEVVVDAASGSSGLAARDERMRTVVLESATYPVIRFLPSAIDGALGQDGAIHGAIRGVLELHGGAHPVEIAVEGRLDGDALTAVGRLAVPYVAWGLADPSLLFLRVGDVVEIEAHVAGTIVRPVEESRR